MKAKMIKVLVTILLLTSWWTHSMEQFNIEERPDSTMCAVDCCLSKRCCNVMIQMGLWGWALGYPFLAAYALSQTPEDSGLTEIMDYVHIAGWVTEPCVCAGAVWHLKNNIKIHWRKRGQTPCYHPTDLESTSEDD